MDTTTVLEIIEMIRTQKAQHTEKFNNTEFIVGRETDGYYYNGMILGLTKLENHLQSFIENQLNALENQTEQ
jgi:hypothetical protein